jgi:hypothetical protein
MNGAYSQKEVDGSFSHWVKAKDDAFGEIWLEQFDRRWRFVDFDFGRDTNMSIGQGTLRSSPDRKVPSKDFFLTPTEEHEVRFQCGICGSPDQSPSTGGVLAASDAQSTEDGESDSTTGIVVAIAVVVALFVLVPVWLLYAKRRGVLHCPCRRSAAVKDNTGDVSTPTGCEPDLDWKQQNASLTTGVAMPGSDGGWSLKSAPTGWREWEAPAARNFRHTWREGESDAQSNHSKKAAATAPDGFAFADRGVASVADALGRVSPEDAAHRTYEGPMSLWWQDGRANEPERSHAQWPGTAGAGIGNQNPSATASGLPFSTTVFAAHPEDQTRDDTWSEAASTAGAWRTNKKRWGVGPPEPNTFSNPVTSVPGLQGVSTPHSSNLDSAFDGKVDAGQGNRGQPLPLLFAASKIASAVGPPPAVPLAPISLPGERAGGVALAAERLSLNARPAGAARALAAPKGCSLEADLEVARNTMKARLEQSP